MARYAEIYSTWDIDGIQGHAPFPRGTAKDLLLGTFKPPIENSSLKDFKHPTGLIAMALIPFAHLNYVAHKVRKVDEIGRQSLEAFKQAAELHDRLIIFAVLSGREPPMHPMTKQQLVEWGTAGYFNVYHLNSMRSSSGFKVNTVRRLLDENPDRVIVHIDDDLKPALGIGLLDPERTVVYVKKNASTHPLLLKRSNVELPNNVKIVDHQMQAAEDFEERLRNSIL